MSLSRLAALALFALALSPLACASADAEPQDELTGSSEDELSRNQCGSRYAEVVLYAPGGGQLPITDELVKAKNDCVQYYVTVPLNTEDKTNFHPQALVTQEIARIHALGPNFHALAQFQWGAWSAWVKGDKSHTWKKAGLEFRKRMATAGFTVKFNVASDTWFIDELSSSLLNAKPAVSDDYRGDVIDAISTLFDGGGLSNKMGGVAHTGHSHYDEKAANDADREGGLRAHKALVKDLLADNSFWASFGKYAKWFAEETYAEPHVICDPSAKTGEQAVTLNNYTEHLLRLAETPGASPAARAYLKRAHLPLVQASWLQDNGWGNTMANPSVMSRFLSLEVYSARAFDDGNANTARRIGFAVVPPRINDSTASYDEKHPYDAKMRAEQEEILVPLYKAQNPGVALPAADPQRAVVLGKFAKAEFEPLMTHLGQALNAGYGTLDSTAVRACLTQGTFTGCDCNMQGGTLDPFWGPVFGTWN